MKEKLEKFLEKIRDSEAYHQLKTKYDELDSQAKLYVNLGGIAAGLFLVFLSLVVPMARLSLLKSRIDDREETIGFLQRSADQIKQLQAASRAHGNIDTTSPLPSFVQSIFTTAGIDPQKTEVGAEKAGDATKDAVETMVDVRLSQVNLIQIQQFIYSANDQGSARGLNIKNLEIDTKGDPSGWMDASMTLSYFKAK